MTAHVRSLDDGDRSISTARLTLYAGIVTALITAVPATIAAIHDFGEGDVASTQPSTVITDSPLGSIDAVTVDGSDVYVTGSARPDVSSVVVMIPGRKEGGNYWYTSTEVHDQKWDAVIQTGADLPSKFRTIARYREDQPAVAALAYAPDPSTPPPPPGVDANCVVQNGDACFTQPGWGQASVSEVER
ncbi:MAG: hypothetical protein HYZ38_17995 [Mycobacterium sp.]|nr:hypothetical protein [Mycobacterium sp.]